MTNIVFGASILSALATLAIAFFTYKTIQLTQATLKLNKSIQESAAEHQRDIKQLQINLVAASLYAARNISGKTLKTGTLREFVEMVEEQMD